MLDISYIETCDLETFLSKPDLYEYYHYHILLYLIDIYDYFELSRFCVGCFVSFLKTYFCLFSGDYQQDTIEIHTTNMSTNRGMCHGLIHC